MTTAKPQSEFLLPSPRPHDVLGLTMDYLNLVQWPAMMVTVVAAWDVASRAKTNRGVGFWYFLTSNALWIVWGLHAAAYALVALQVCLAIINVRGAKKNEAL